MVDDHDQERSGIDRRKSISDASLRRLMLLLGVAAAVGGGVTKLADAMIFGLVTPQDFKQEVEARFSFLEGAITTTRSADSLRMVEHERKIEPLVDSVRALFNVVETGTLLGCLKATKPELRDYALLRVNCEDVAERFGVQLGR